MTILYTGRKANLTPALKAAAEVKLEKLEKVLGDILGARVILTREKHRQVAEIKIRARSRTLSAKGEATDFTDAIGVAADRLMAQARRHSDRRVALRKGGARWKQARRARAVAPEIPEPAAIPGIVRIGSTTVPVLSLREAALRARDEGPEVMVFRDAASKQVAILYRRPDGLYGLVETEG